MSCSNKFIQNQRRSYDKIIERRTSSRHRMIQNLRKFVNCMIVSDITGNQRQQRSRITTRSILNHSLRDNVFFNNNNNESDGGGYCNFMDVSDKILLENNLYGFTHKVREMYENVMILRSLEMIYNYVLAPEWKTNRGYMRLQIQCLGRTTPLTEEESQFLLDDIPERYREIVYQISAILEHIKLNTGGSVNIHYAIFPGGIPRSPLQECL